MQPASQFKSAMSTDDFRIWGKKMVDYICEYLDGLEDRNVIPDVEPGYLRPMIPESAPEEPEQWPEIFNDIDNLIMPGITHWQHPRFHAYFPAGNSFPSIMGDMLGDALGTIGFSWAASPAMAELEIVVLDWLAKLMVLPKQFTHEGTGGGALQGSASDSILCSMLAARYQAIENHKDYFEQAGNSFPETAVLSRLVAYCSNLAHSSVEKAGMISFVNVRQVDIDEEFSMRIEALEETILASEDIKQGFIPFYVCATLGTTACCSFDNVSKIGPIARRYNLWFHIDGAYGVNSCICPEFRHYLDGVELADSVNFNPNKWLLTNFDASVLWVADKNVLTRSMVVNPVYLQHKFSSKAIDFRHWGIPLSRRFRALKLWFVIRNYGAKGLRAYIRNHVRLAKLFASLVESDPQFEIVGKVELGLVCFRIKGSNVLTQCLIRTINESRELHVVPAVVNDLYIIRFAVCREDASDDDIHHAWKIIRHFADLIINAEATLRQWRVHTRENSIRKKRRARAAASALNLKEHLAEGNKESNLDNVPEVEEKEYSDADSEDDQDDLGELETMDMHDDDIIELATERLMDLKEIEAKEAYDVLAQQLRNLGVTEVKNYEECDLENNGLSEITEESTAKELTTKELPEPETPDPAPPSVVFETPDKEQKPEEHAYHNTRRMGRFKSLSYAIALQGYDKVAQESNRISQHNPDESLRLSTQLMQSEGASFLNGTLDGNLGEKLGQDAVSSTPFARAERSSRRFSSFNPPSGGNMNPSGGTPVVARLASMLMNASGNATMNTTSLRSNRSSMRPSVIEDVKAEPSEKSTALNQTQTPITEVSQINRSTRKFPNGHNTPWRIGMNQEDDIDEVFACETDLGVGTPSKESTLTRLRRQTLLKMISDPISSKNRRSARFLRDQRRLTTLIQDYEPRERPKSEYSRRPTVQVCENLHKVMNHDQHLDDGILVDLKRRNKSMIEAGSFSPELEQSPINNDSLTQHLSNTTNEIQNKPLNNTTEHPIPEEDEAS
ncbi:hypothetical protein Ciccas_005822 [Cichlidogyrus casuarinus]|uniref:Tyrosine decarboxylase n=1 Tax=Cichlidogyrus casuarinus TaxID=1844966 RepID=A0ABD2Q7J6_9PLAT